MSAKIPIILLLLCWAAGSSVRSQAPEERTNFDPVLIVNGHAVSPAEFQWFAQLERTGVIQFVTSKLRVDYGPDFWTRELYGASPRALLQQRTIARVRREKIEQTLFAELGLITDISHTAFLNALAAANRERREAVRQGRVVYGPTNYTPEQFYNHRSATWQIRAKELLAQSRLVATDAELEASFQRSGERYRSPALSTWELVAIHAGQAAPPAGAAPQLVRDVTDERLGEMIGRDESLRTLLGLRAGESAAVSEPDGGKVVAKCLARTPGKLRPFAEVKASVAARWIDEHYEDLLTALAAEAKVQVNQRALDKISMQ